MPDEDSYGLLLATVGNRDPETPNGPMGALRAASDLHPARTILLATPGVEKQAMGTKRAIERALPGATVMVELVGGDDPTDFNAIAGDLRRVLRDMESRSQGLVAVCPTSSTPQMRTAVTLAAANAFEQVQFFEALDPEKAAAGELLRKIDVEVFRHDAEAHHGFSLLASCRPGEAAPLLRRRAESGFPGASWRRPAFRAGSALAGSLDCAERLDLRRAADTAGVTRRGLSAESGELMASVAEWYRGLAGSGLRENSDWPRELAALAWRQEVAGAVTASLVSSCLALEVSLRVRLLEQGIDADRVSTEEAARSEVTPFIKSDREPFRIEGAAALFGVLRAVDPSVESWAAASEETFVGVTHARNVLVHAARQPAQDMMDRARRLLASLFEALDWGGIEECPTVPVAVRRLAILLATEADVAIPQDPPSQAVALR